MAETEFDLRIRPLERSDAAAVRQLLRHLGYAMPQDEVARRIERVLGAADHLALAAERGDGMVGLLHAFVRPALEKPCEVVVQAIVVDAALRGAGIGKALMDAAEAWAAAKGTPSVVLHTRNAEAFYARRGYASVATTRFMRKGSSESAKR